MANSNSNLDLLAQSQAGKDITINALFDAMSVASIYGRRQLTTTGLKWGYYGGNVQASLGVFAIPNGEVALTPNVTNYIMASMSDGAVKVSTNVADWNDTVANLRLYEVIVGATMITSYVDYRVGAGTGGGGGGSGIAVITVGATAPTSPSTGTAWYDTTAPAMLKIWDGTAWASSAAAPALGLFDTTKAYAVDDLVVHTGKLYRAKAAVAAGAFNPADWDEIGASGGGTVGPITAFSATATYAPDDLVVEAGKIYRAKAILAAGAFNAADWDEIGAGGGAAGPITAFSINEAYAIDDVVVYSGKLYRAMSAVAGGPWNSALWYEIGETAVPSFDPREDYAGAALVVRDGKIYRAKSTVGTGPFNPVHWVNITPDPVAPEYDAQSLYQKGQLALYNGQIYVATAVTGNGAFWPASWRAISLVSPIQPFDSTVAYVTNDLVVEAGKIYRAKAAVAAAAFNAAEWDEIGGGGGGGTPSWGGTTNQATSKSTGVSVDADAGLISINDESLAANAVATFTFLNNNIGIQDSCLIVKEYNVATAGKYRVWAGEITQGQVDVHVENITSNALAEAFEVRYTVIRPSA
jgi:hypothetical protein